MGNKESSRMKKRKKELDEFLQKEAEDVYLGPCDDFNHKKKPYPCMLCMNTRICDNCAFKGGNKDRNHCAMCKLALQ